MKLKRIALGGGAVLLCIGLLFLALIGPWPTYAAADIAQTRYQRRNTAALDAAVAANTWSERPGPLSAGWAKRSITPEPGVPLAGYGERRGQPSTGMRHELYVKALVLHDGDDYAAIVGSDMLIVPENIADLVRADVAGRSPLTANDVLFNASHTHSGPGAWGPGFLARQFGGKYDARVVEQIAKAFSDAIVEAYESLGPARLGHGRVAAPEFIRNRAREDAPTDDMLAWMVVEKSDGSRCHVVRYSAHSTVIGAGNMEFCGDYPGYAQRAIERETGGFAMFLAGAMGSMGPRAPGSGDAFEKAEALGEALAARVLDNAADTALEDRVEVASAGIPLSFPSFQFRIGRSWRLSPFFFRMAGLDRDGWLQCVRIGDLYLAGTPCDFSGEIGRELTAWGDASGHTLWALSFNGDYVGYISPDRYYADARRKGMEGYEMYIMSWIGPNQEELFTTLIRRAVASLAEPLPASP